MAVGVDITRTSARIASQTLFESIFWLRPFLDSPEHVPDENTADESCLFRPNASDAKASKSTATNCYTESF
jgi:hypothetical protein